MKASKTLSSALVSAALIGGIGLAYAQTGTSSGATDAAAQNQGNNNLGTPGTSSGNNMASPSTSGTNGMTGSNGTSGSMSGNSTMGATPDSSGSMSGTTGAGTGASTTDATGFQSERPAQPDRN